MATQITNFGNLKTDAKNLSPKKNSLHDVLHDVTDTFSRC